MPVDIGVFGLAPARSTLAVVLVLTCGVATTGCTRTDDGSMMLSRPSMSLGFGRLSERFAERRRARAQQIAASQQFAEPTAFPPPPSPPVVEAAAPKPQRPYRVILYLAKPFSPSPAGSIFTAFTSPMRFFALGPVSKMTLVFGSDANDQLESAEGLIVP
jgi:hypothetical protein